MKIKNLKIFKKGSKMIHTSDKAIVLIILIFSIVGLLTIGEPDILDGIIKKVNNIECTTQEECLKSY